MEQYKCGHCGNGTYELFQVDDEEKIITVCTKCNSKTNITVNASLHVDWNENEDKGCMCIGWSK